LLVAYSTHLVKGQLPIDDATPFRCGTPLPSVWWRRDDDQHGGRRRLVARRGRRDPGSRPAWASRWPASAERIGAAIDKLAFEFPRRQGAGRGVAGGAARAADPLPAIDHHLQRHRDRPDKLASRTRCATST
jgi:hypothetical protein